MASSAHASVEERVELGRSLRKRAPRSEHAEWSPAPSRPDPIALVEAQNASRVDWLVPVRRARMAASPFAFYRGCARVMAGFAHLKSLLPRLDANHRIRAGVRLTPHVA